MAQDSGLVLKQQIHGKELQFIQELMQYIVFIYIYYEIVLRVQTKQTSL